MQTQRMKEFSNDVANELATYDDLMMAGENLANNAHDMDVMRLYLGFKAQLEEKIIDERFETMHNVIYLDYAYLSEGDRVGVNRKLCQVDSGRRATTHLI